VTFHHWKLRQGKSCSVTLKIGAQGALPGNTLGNHA
jgi:hypothetical protein